MYSIALVIGHLMHDLKILNKWNLSIKCEKWKVQLLISVMKTNMILQCVFVLEQSSTISALLRFIQSMHTLNMLFQISLHNKYDNWKPQRRRFVGIISSKCYVCPSFVLFVHFNCITYYAISMKKHTLVTETLLQIKHRKPEPSSIWAIALTAISAYTNKVNETN